MKDISARELKGHNILAVERFWDNRDKYPICGGRNGVSSPRLPPLFLFARILAF